MKKTYGSRCITAHATRQPAERARLKGRLDRINAAYFGIWLGREPIDEKLKHDLLKGR